MKGEYPSLSYTLFTVISIVVLSLLMVWVSSFSENVQNSYAYNQLNYAADVVRNSVLDIYSTNAQASLPVPIPKYITGKQYAVELSNNTIKLSMNTGRRTIEVSRTLDISANLSGRSYAPISIELRRSENISIVI
jgi:hypothetical protein